jgi:putative lipoprotein
MIAHQPVLVAAVLLCFAAAPALAAKISLPGQVTYRERIALPQDAQLRVELIDESTPGAPPRLDVSAPIGPGQVPLSFQLSFEDALILPSHSYALIAEISVARQLMFRNYAPYAVNPLAPIAPVLIVANLVGQPTEDTVSSSSSTPPAAPATPALLDTTWTATTLGGKPLLPRTAPSLLIGDDLRAGGNGGCNSWFAQAEIDGDSLRFGGVTATLKGCTQSINLQERAYFDALAATATWRVAGDTLSLFDAGGTELLSFSR